MSTNTTLNPSAESSAWIFHLILQDAGDPNTCFWRDWRICDVMTLHHNVKKYVIMSKLHHVVLFEVMAYCLTSRQALWRHGVPFDVIAYFVVMTNYFMSWLSFDVILFCSLISWHTFYDMTYFLRSWRNFVRHVVADVMTYIMTYCWHMKNRLMSWRMLTSWRTFWRHDRRCRPMGLAHTVETHRADPGVERRVEYSKSLV